ncbi:hypothetical protein FocTR4_00013864 [Fusarium oxysporum f. sp. cubense]|uniref:Uncharacterized protein n=1 Tax=Fusarium oxysporum f. sp. cubense TaxID=61366 RepID=A0A5C6SNN2_FUSOC|nr:hypothetical protein FocTR4_00013864 [Fusarium oxysporum f. sp. cubense]
MGILTFLSHMPLQEKKGPECCWASRSSEVYPLLNPEAMDICGTWPGSKRVYPLPSRWVKA